MTIPELQGVTPEEAAFMLDHPDRLDAWIERTGLRGMSLGLLSALASLAFCAEEAEASAVAARRETARLSSANRHRKDAAMLVAFADAAEGRLPPRQVLVCRLCVEEGLTIAEAAVALGISRETVRAHLREVRGKARRNAIARTAAKSPPVGGGYCTTNSER